MTAASALACPKCRRALDASAWVDTSHGSCIWCQTEFEFTGFPALTARRAAVEARRVEAADHASCFYHPENEAESVCDGCGRLICAVCSISVDGSRVCPSCVSTRNATAETAVPNRVLFGGIAFSLAVLPILFWPVTIVTAPAALAVAIVGWRKPRSLVRPGPGSLIAAGIIALLQIAAWIFGITFFLAARDN